MDFNLFVFFSVPIPFQIRSEQPYYSADPEVDSLVSIPLGCPCFVILYVEHIIKHNSNVYLITDGTSNSSAPVSPPRA